MVLEGAPTLQERFRQARPKVVEMLAGRQRPGRTYPGFVKTRRRLTRAPIRVIKRPLCRYHRQVAGPFWPRDNWLAFAADGMWVQLPRTTQNEKAFGGAARRELDGALPAYLVLGLRAVQTQVETHRDPLAWSVAAALRVVRAAWCPGRGSCPRGGLVRQWRQAVKDHYVRQGAKAARHWPRKKNDHPPGLPKMRAATPQEKHGATRTYERSNCA